jgi:hypothetical protein
VGRRRAGAHRAQRGGVLRRWRAGLALEVGQTDARFDAIVAWDPASSGTLGPIGPITPTMIQLADYSLRDGAVAGLFDPDAAEGNGDEAGNVPIEIAGIPVANLLSFHYPSRYSLDGSTLQCDDLRAGCET